MEQTNMQQFNNEELKNIGVLLQRVDLKGNEALAVATLQMKISKMLEPVAPVETKEEVTPAA